MYVGGVQSQELYLYCVKRVYRKCDFCMKNDIKNICMHIVSIICFLIQIFLLLINAGIAYYTTPWGDDFFHATVVGAKRQGIVRLIQGSVHLVKERYFGWGGVYFSNFIQGMLGPLNGYGCEQMQIVMVVGVILLWSGLLLCIYVILRQCNLPLYCAIIIQGLLMFLLLFYRLYADIISWFSGATSYTFPLIMLWLTIIISSMNGFDSITIKIDGEKNKIYFYCLCASVCSFCMSGGALLISGAGCYLLLLGIIETYLNKGEIKNKIIVFGTGVCGAFINAFAPGNFVRAGTSVGNLNISVAIKNAFAVVLQEYEWLFKKGLGIGFLILFLLGTSVHIWDVKKIEIRATVSALGLGLPIVSAIPCVLGYSSAELNSRAYFVIDLFILSSFFVFSLFIGVLSKIYLSNCGRSIASYFLSILIIASFFFTNDIDKTEKISLMQMQVLKNGELAIYYDECIELLNDLPNHIGEDVVLDMTPMPPLGYYGFMVTSNVDNWLNVGISQWYGLNSICVK